MPSMIRRFCNSKDDGAEGTPSTHCSSHLAVSAPTVFLETYCFRSPSSILHFHILYALSSAFMFSRTKKIASDCRWPCGPGELNCSFEKPEKGVRRVVLLFMPLQDQNMTAYTSYYISMHVFTGKVKNEFDWGCSSK